MKPLILLTESGMNEFHTIQLPITAFPDASAQDASLTPTGMQGEDKEKFGSHDQKSWLAGLR